MRSDRRVWIISNSIGIGGAERLSVQWANALAEYVSVTLYCWLHDGGIHRQELDRRVSVLRHKDERSLFVSLGKERPWMVINNTTSGLLPMAHRVAAHTAHFVQIIHSTSAWSRRFLDASLLELCNKIVVVAPYLIRDLLALGIPREKLLCIQNPVDSTVFAPMDMKDARTDIGLPTDLPLVTYVGRASWEKGIRHIPKLLSVSRSRGTPVRAVLVGLTEQGHVAHTRAWAAARRKLLQIVRAERIRDLWIERRPVANPRKYYCASDAVLLLSDQEGSPLCVAEAMACGRPLIATEVGDSRLWCIPETGSIVIPPGENAAVHAANALSVILERAPEESETMARNAREYVVALRGIDAWKENAFAELLEMP